MTNLMNKFIDSQASRLETILEDQLKLVGCGDNPLVPIVFVGSGSSLNAALASKPYFARFTANQLEYLTPLEYIETKRFIQPQVLVAISQTGSSIATIRALEEAHQAHHQTVLLTANQGFHKGESIDYLIDLRCWEEQIGPKTIGFTATVVRLIQLSLVIGQGQGWLTSQESQPVLQGLSAEIAEISKIKKATLAWLETHSHWQELAYATVCATSELGGIAAEGALKLLETLRIPVTAYEIAEFTHGPHRLMKKNSYHIFIVTGKDRDLSLKVKKYAENLGCHVLCLSTLSELSDITLGDNQLMPQEILLSVVFQVLANELALGTGFNPDQKVYPDFFNFVGTKN